MDRMGKAPLSVERLPESERFTLVAGGDHPAIPNAALGRHVMGAKLVGLVQWTEMHAVDGRMWAGGGGAA